jgi:hypothetical protein
VAYDKLGKYDKAIEALELGIKEEDSPILREKLAEIKEKVGK